MRASGGTPSGTKDVWAGSIAVAALVLLIVLGAASPVLAATDTTPPETEWYAAPMRVDTLPVEFYFRSSEPGSTFECKIDDGPFETCTSPKEYTSLSDGPHTFYVRATDAAGNVDPTPDSFSWTVDTRKPVTTIDSGPSGEVIWSTARFEFSADEPGVEYVCSLVHGDEGGEYLCDSPQEFSGLTDGTYTFSVRAFDPAGNTGADVTRTWTVVPETLTQDLAPGVPVTTDAEGDGATASDRVETAITSPVGGATSVTETSDPTQTEPANYSFLGQQVNITTPPSTADDPLRFEFVLDTSLVPAGEDKDTIQIFRNGVQVQDCAEPSLDVAQPDPCVLGREALPDGDVRFSILTSAASSWNFGVFDDAPKVSGVTPADPAKKVSARTNVTATFSEEMMINTINADSFVLVKQGAATQVGARVSYDAITRKAKLNPKRDLKPGATYVATVKGGAGGVTDSLGNALARDKVWVFTIKKR